MTTGHGQNRQDINQLEKEADIVVIGGGGSGLAAAVAASEKGANVIVLEKRRSAGGSSAMAGGLFAAESLAQIQQQVDVPKDEVFKMAMNWTHWRVNPRLVRAMIEKSGDTIQWLESMGTELTFLPKHDRVHALRTWHCHPMPSPSAGHRIIKVLLKACEKLGVRFFYETETKKILLDAKGNVTGVLATTKGKEFKIATRSVIIGTGGFAGSKELLNKYCAHYGDNMSLAGAPNMGEGLLLAMEAGSATEGLGGLLAGFAYLKSELVSDIALEPNTMWVNKKGERFFDESYSQFALVGNAVDRQPDKMCYVLFDQIVRENAKLDPTWQSKKLDDPETEFQAEARKGTIKISNSWDSIAEWIGSEPAVLKDTISEYNSFCDHGYDECFSKDRRYLQPLRTPPYYAVRLGLTILATLGGIKINHHMQAINNDDNPIPGLYVVGNDAGGWQWDTYTIDLPGFAFGFAINSGRIAGENAVKFVLG